MDIEIDLVKNLREFEEEELKRAGCDYRIVGDVYIIDGSSEIANVFGTGSSDPPYPKTLGTGIAGIPSSETALCLADLGIIFPTFNVSIDDPTKKLTMRASVSTAYLVRFKVNGESLAVVLDTRSHWKAVSFRLARKFSGIVANQQVAAIKKKLGRPHSKAPRIKPKRLPTIRFMGKTCQALRDLRDKHGLTFTLKGHALSRMIPEHVMDGSFEDMNPLWTKDSVFRAFVMMLIRNNCHTMNPLNIGGEASAEDLVTRSQSLFRASSFESMTEVADAYRLSDLSRVPPYGFPVIRKCGLHEVVDSSVMHATYLRSWADLRNYAASFQSFTTRKLIKPFRRRLASGKLSAKMACPISAMNVLQQEKLYKMPIWFWCFIGDLNIYTGPVLLLAQPLGKNKFVSLLEERNLRILSDTYSRCQELVDKKLIPHMPKNIRQLLKLDTAWHDNMSSLRIAYDNMKKTDTWVFDELPTGLPDVGEISYRILKTGAEYRQEGIDMGHCVGSYAGFACLLLHIERGTDKATLMVSKKTYSTQCYGPHNTENSLVLDLRLKWIPVLQPLVDDAEVKTASGQDVKTIQVYDENANRDRQNRENGERRVEGNRYRNKRKSRTKRARSGSSKRRDRKSERGAKGGTLPGDKRDDNTDAVSVAKER